MRSEMLQARLEHALSIWAPWVTMCLSACANLQDYVNLHNSLVCLFFTAYNDGVGRCKNRQKAQKRKQKASVLHLKMITGCVCVYLFLCTRHITYHTSHHTAFRISYWSCCTIKIPLAFLRMVDMGHTDQSPPPRMAFISDVHWKG